MYLKSRSRIPHPTPLCRLIFCWMQPVSTDKLCTVMNAWVPNPPLPPPKKKIITHPPQKESCGSICERFQFLPHFVLNRSINLTFPFFGRLRSRRWSSNTAISFKKNRKNIKKCWPNSRKCIKRKWVKYPRILRKPNKKWLNWRNSEKPRLRNMWKTWRRKRDNLRLISSQNLLASPNEWKVKPTRWKRL